MKRINKYLNGVKIIGTEGTEILKSNANVNGDVKFKGVMPYSMLLNKLLNMKDFNVTKSATTRQIMSLDFSYGADIEGQESKNRKDLRKDFYSDGYSYDFKDKDGVIYDTVNYNFWYRSASKSRTGQLFTIDNKLRDEITNWQNMGVNINSLVKKDGTFDIIGWENYRGLTSSAIEAWCDLKPNEILVLSDLDSYTDKMNIISVDYNEEEGVTANKKEGVCKNTIWDGMMLLDKSRFDQCGYGEHGQITLRHHFFKACAFNTNLVDYLKDFYGDKYETARIKDRYNRTIMVKNIRAITTENAMKWEKFLGHTKEAYTIWANAVKTDGTGFGICKTDHKSKYGTKQRMSYQMVNSLPINKQQTNELLGETLDYINKLKNDDEFFVEYLKLTQNEMNNNSLLIDLYKHNKNIVKSYMFKNVRKKLINSFVTNVRAGKILVQGDNLTVCGNPYLLLQYATGQLKDCIKDNVFYGEDKTLPILKEGISVYTNRFSNGEELATFRNPHNAPNNISYSVNHKSEEMDKWFNFGDTIMAINCVRTDCQDRANSMDFDSDFQMVTNNGVVVNSAKESVKKYATIVNNIGQHTKPFYVCDENGKYDENVYYTQLAEIDINFAKAKTQIGETSNLAQIALSHMWHKHTEELENSVAILSVFAQVAIDGVKRQYDCNLVEEIKKIRRSNALTTEVTEIKKNKEVIKRYALPKPKFWKNTNDCVKKNNIEKVLRNKHNSSNKYKNWKDLTKEEKDLEIKEYKQWLLDSFVNINCPMNYVNNICEEEIERASVVKGVRDVDFLLLKDMRKLNDSTTQMRAKRLIDKIKEFDLCLKNCETLKTNGEDEECIGREIKLVYNEYIKQIKKMKIDEKTMNLCIYRALDTDNKHLANARDIKVKILNTLYRRDKEMFLNCFKTYDYCLLEEQIEEEFKEFESNKKNYKLYKYTLKDGKLELQI